MAGKIRILCVDDHAVMRDGIAYALQTQPDMELVGEAASGEDALRAFRELRPDITLIVSRGIYLLAANDPREFDLTPGSCSVGNGVGTGCKPLISVDHATGDGIMGDGVIDGRGVVSRLISVDNSNNFTLYRINLRDEAGLNLSFDHGSGLTLWGVHVKAAASANNAMGGIAIGSAARNVAITQSYVVTATSQTEVQINSAQQPAP